MGIDRKQQIIKVSTVVLNEIAVTVLPDGRMNRADAALYIGVSQKTLARWQNLGTGPANVLVGGFRFYFKDDIDKFIKGG